MAKIKVGDKVLITTGLLSGAVSTVIDIIPGEGVCGSDLYHLATNPPFSSSYVAAYYEDDEFNQVK